MYFYDIKKTESFNGHVGYKILRSLAIELLFKSNTDRAIDLQIQIAQMAVLENI